MQTMAKLKVIWSKWINAFCFRTSLFSQHETHWCGSLPTNSPRIRIFHGRNQKCPLLFITSDCTPFPGIIFHTLALLMTSDAIRVRFSSSPGTKPSNASYRQEILCGICYTSFYPKGCWRGWALAANLSVLGQLLQPTAHTKKLKISHHFSHWKAQDELFTLQLWKWLGEMWGKTKVAFVRCV